MAEFQQKAFGLAVKDNSGVFSPFEFSRRENGDDDLTIKVLYCGVCHSDLHNAKNEWGFTHYPIVPGHEIVGLVTKAGKNVEKFMVGERVGVGIMVNSCGTCDACQQGLENYCEKMTLTYNYGIDKDGTRTFGGYSDTVVVNHNFVLRFPENIPSAAGAPLLGAGITVYSPMKYYGMTTEPGKHLGVAGLGGLGHVAVKIAKAFGLKVTVISHSPNKRDEAINKLGADAFLLSTDAAELEAAANTMDFIIDTIPAAHDLGLLLDLLKLNGKIVTIGLPDQPINVPMMHLVARRKMICGTEFGSIKETEEMLDFCAKHGITADIELIRAHELNAAMERLAKSDVKYRFVIDIANSLTNLSHN